MNSTTLLTHDELRRVDPDLDKLRAAYRLRAKDGPAAKLMLHPLAEAGSVLAMLYLAELYRKASPPDLDQSKFWYRRALDNNALNAAYNLGTLCFHRNEIEEARSAFLRGVGQGDGPCLYRLARLYLAHPEVGGSSKEIEELIGAAMAQGQVRARNHLGWNYMKGEYGRKNFRIGLYHYLRSLVEAFQIGIRNPNDRRLW